MLFARAVNWSPNRNAFEETHGVDVFGAVAGESVVDALWKCHEVTCFDVDADPFVLLVTHIEVA